MEDEGGQAADEHDVEGRVLDQAGFDGEPDEQGQRGERRLDHDARRAHHHALTLVLEGRRGRGVHVGYRH